MKKTDITIIGAGPAGLTAAVQAAKLGASVLIVDEHDEPGGQLFKQIHKFFGSQEHKAGIRGIDIGRDLLDEVDALGVEVWLGATAFAIYPEHVVGVVKKDRTCLVQSKAIILACGATEKALAFPGWTLPGVMGAGAAQTMINYHRVLPGKRVLMVGSGNVGLIVAYQLLQAGAEVAAIVEAAPRIGGYAVHAAKVRRRGVPIFVSHTVQSVRGKDRVEEAVIVALDEDWNPVPGEEKTLTVDTVCLAVGLSPMNELALMAGCRLENIPELGGFVPVHNERMESTVPGLFVAGDVSGVEEASTAMEEGRLAGIYAAATASKLSWAEAEKKAEKCRRSMEALRLGPFGTSRLAAKKRIIARAGDES